MTQPDPAVDQPDPTFEQNKDDQVLLLVEQINMLTAQRDIALWLHAEIEYKVKVMAARQLMNRPDIQERMQQLLIAEIDKQGKV